MRSESSRPFARRASVRGVILTLAVLARPALAAEREPEEAAPPSSSSEIQNAIQRICPQAPERGRPLFPWFRKPLQKLPSFFELGEDLQLNDLLAELVRHYLERALEEAEGNKTKAAELVGLSSYQTLTNWMERYGVKPLKRSRSR